MRVMTETPHTTPPAGPEHSDEPAAPIAPPPPVGRRAQDDRTGQVGQKDTDSGPDGEFSDPDEYADPHARAPS